MRAIYFQNTGEALRYGMNLILSVKQHGFMSYKRILQCILSLQMIAVTGVLDNSLGI